MESFQSSRSGQNWKASTVSPLVWRFPPQQTWSLTNPFPRKFAFVGSCLDGKKLKSIYVFVLLQPGAGYSTTVISCCPCFQHARSASFVPSFCVAFQLSLNKGDLLIRDSRKQKRQTPSNDRVEAGANFSLSTEFNFRPAPPL